MIDPKELRLGNLLKSETGEILPVAYIHEDVIALRNNIGGVQKHQKNPIISYDIDKLEYVPLSEELLIRFGFNFEFENDIRKHYKFYDNSLLIEIDLYKTGKVFFKFNHFRINDDIVNYAHHIQNFYFDLKKEQLTLKP